MAEISMDERHRLCATAVTLDGKPANISGASDRYATVRQIPDGFGWHWTWDATARIVANGGDFRS